MSRKREDFTKAEIKILETLGIRAIGFNKLQEETGLSARTLNNYLGKHPEKEYKNRNLVGKGAVEKIDGKYKLTEKGVEYFQAIETTTPRKSRDFIIVQQTGEAADNSTDIAAGTVTVDRPLSSEERGRVEKRIEDEVLRPLRKIFEENRIGSARAILGVKKHKKT